MFDRLNFHALGLLIAEWIGLGASAEAFWRFLHGPHAVAAANFLAALLVATYTHAVRRRHAAAPTSPLDVAELARLIRAELEPARPRIHEPDRPATVDMADGRQATTRLSDLLNVTVVPGVEGVQYIPAGLINRPLRFVRPAATTPEKPA